MRNVVVTGLGAISPLGLSVKDTFESLLLGRSGVGFARDEVTAMLPNALQAAVPKEFAALMPRSDSQFDRATQLGLWAAREAIKDANLESPALDRDRVGVYVGTGMGGASSLEPLYTRMLARKFGAEAGDPASTHPLTVPRIMPNATAALISIIGHFRGPTMTYCVACASSAVALGEAYRAIQYGIADCIIVVGTESMMTLGSFAAWNALRVTASPDSQDVAASCKPFDKKRSGFVMGEGACALVLESAESAEARGQEARARIVGYGTSSDATHMTLPSRDGQVIALKQALKESGLQPEAIGYINAHGTATEAGDTTETESIKEVFGEHAYRLAISSTKSMHGHLIGGGGAMEFAISILALESGDIPPTANLTNPDPACDLDYVPCEARHEPLRAVLSNSFAFGGTNVALIAQRAHA